MFQKALWLRTYQQSKYVVWLFWLISFYTLSYKYYMTSIEQQHFLNMNKNGNLYIITTLIYHLWTLSYFKVVYLSFWPAH